MARAEDRGMGRGLEAILSVSAVSPRADEAREDELRELPVELIAPNPNQPRRQLRRGGAARRWRGSLGERGVLQPVLVRPRAGGTLRAGRRRAALARGADRGPRDHPGARARARGRRSDRAGADREHGARGPQPDRGGPRMRGARRGAGPDARAGRAARGRSRVAVSNLMRLLDLPDEVIELIEQGTLSEGHGRALLLAEDHGARSEPRARGRARRAGRCARSKRARARSNDAGGDATPRASRAAAAAGEVHPDQEQAAREIAEALGAALGAEVQREGRRRRRLSRGAVVRSRPTRRSSWRGVCARARSRAAGAFQIVESFAARGHFTVRRAHAQGTVDVAPAVSPAITWATARGACSPRARAISSAG